MWRGFGCSVFKKEKREICGSNEIIQAVYYERDKHYAHKDTDYNPKEYATLLEMADAMKAQIRCIRKICSDKLPDNITLDFVSHDKRLFRQIYQITPEIEEQIKQQKHPFYSRKPPKSVKQYPSKKVFNDTEEINRMMESAKDDYAVIVEEGLNYYEGLQNRQDFCIKVNVLYNFNMWSVANPILVDYYLDCIEELATKTKKKS